MDSLYLCYRTKDEDVTILIEKHHTKDEGKVLSKYEAACKIREWADDFFSMSGPDEEGE